jgi:hypothetical protein
MSQAAAASALPMLLAAALPAVRIRLAIATSLYSGSTYVDLGTDVSACTLMLITLLHL